MSLEPASRARVSRRSLQPRPGRTAQAGVGLLEVMISVLILGIGLLGIAAMQATALRNGQSSLERTQAVIQTYAILDLLRANRTDAIAGYYNTAGAMKCNAAEIDDSLPAGQLAAQGQLNAWMASYKRSMGLPADDQSACAMVACAGNAIGGGTCTVTVQWDDSLGSKGGDAEDVNSEGGSNRRAVTVTAL